MVSDRVIVALDVPDLHTALQLCDRLPTVSHYKVGLELFISCGKEILSALQERGKEIFLDLKLHDIPNTVGRACQVAVQYGVKFLSVHASGGKTMLAEAQQAVAGSPTQLLAVTVLTSLSNRELALELKIPLELSEYVLHLAEISYGAGITGLVCSPHELAIVRSLLGKQVTIVTPGVRPYWAEAGDQERRMSPRQALEAGADYLVIGRPITHHPDPLWAWTQICEELAPN